MMLPESRGWCTSLCVLFCSDEGVKRTQEDSHYLPGITMQTLRALLYLTINSSDTMSLCLEAMANSVSTRHSIGSPR